MGLAAIDVASPPAPVTLPSGYRVEHITDPSTLFDQTSMGTIRALCSHLHDEDAQIPFEQLGQAIRDSAFFVAWGPHDTISRREKIVGMATLCRNTTMRGNYGWLEDVIVDKDHLRRGIGRAILNRVIEHARTLNLCQLWLVTSSENTRAHGFYKAFEFEEVDDISVFMKPVLPLS